MRRFLPWIGALGILIVFMGMTYGVMQQIERQGANDGPLRLASQVSSELARGRSASIDSLPRVDLSNSLALFVVVFGVDGKPSSGNGYLHGALASPPSGVIRTARKVGQVSVTWQPSIGLRFATVSIKSGDRVVMAGQSLAPSEHRTENIGIVIALGGLGAVLILVLTFAAWELFRRREQPRGEIGRHPTSAGMPAPVFASAGPGGVSRRARRVQAISDRRAADQG